MSHLLEPWSKISSLLFEGESTFAETDKSTGETITSPAPGRFKCWLADLQLTKARWECDEEQRRWTFLPFPEPIRYRVEYAPQVLQRESSLHARPEIRICDGKTEMMQNWRGGGNNPTEDLLYFQDDFRAGRQLDQRGLGLCCLPPLISIGASRVMGDIDDQKIAPQLDHAAKLERYVVKIPRSLLEIEVTWDAGKRWFTKIESIRWGFPPVLVDKLRLEGNLNEEERMRLKTERERVETLCYEATEFEGTPQAGIFFPRKISYARDGRKKLEERSWQFHQWSVATEFPNDLFNMTIPVGCRMHDRRKRLL